MQVTNIKHNLKSSTDQEDLSITFYTRRQIVHAFARYIILDKFKLLHILST